MTKNNFSWDEFDETKDEPKLLRATITKDQYAEFKIQATRSGVSIPEFIGSVLKTHLRKSKVK